jgi:DNA-binding response OmpR family regulator
LDRFKSFSLLYIDDDDELRFEASSVFKKLFGNYFEATNGLEALNILQSNHIDVVIADIKMPKMNGLEFSKKARSLGYTLPIILATAYDDKELLKEALKLSIANYIQKPFSIDELFDVLQKSLRINSRVKLANGIYYDIKNAKLTRDNIDIPLTPQEQILLIILYKNKPNIVGYEVLEYSLAKDDYTSKEALRVAINSLRIWVFQTDKIEYYSLRE